MMQTPLLSYSLLRSLVYTTEGMFIPVIDMLVNRHKPRLLTDDIELFKASRKAMLELLKQDVDRIAKGYYPPQVLKPESPLRHLLRIPKLFNDGVKSARRKANKDAHHFEKEAQEFLEGLPQYYQRNFHFQDNGYLSDRSAELYDHQVNVLFAGAAGAMRRLILKPMKDHFHFSDGKNLSILELAAGTGSATKFTRLAFPRAKITLSDLSEPYLKRARKILSDDLRVDFVQADAAATPFRDETFDAVYSVFLFHEVPETERRRILLEAFRCLKPGGFFGFVDSLQLHDNPDFDRALTDFPRDFHEPFYKNYIDNKMEDVFVEAGFEDIHTDTGFFAKVVWATKPAVKVTS